MSMSNFFRYHIFFILRLIHGIYYINCASFAFLMKFGNDMGVSMVHFKSFSFYLSLCEKCLKKILVKNSITWCVVRWPGQNNFV